MLSLHGGIDVIGSDHNLMVPKAHRKVHRPMFRAALQTTTGRPLATPDASRSFVPFGASEVFPSTDRLGEMQEPYRSRGRTRHRTSVVIDESPRLPVMKVGAWAESMVI